MDGEGALPVGQLEFLKFKANQIIESIETLQRTVEAGGQNAMPSWPDILSKYTAILSQTHSFSQSLVSPQTHSGRARHAPNVYESIALHPSAAMTDAQLDNELIPLLRNQQTTDVLNMESGTVRRLAECMVTRGAIATNGMQTGRSPAAGARTTHEDVLRECDEIRTAHDHRVERAVRAVTMLRDKFEWRQRVVVEVEEPEELEWDPRVAHKDVHAGEGHSSDEEDVVAGQLVGFEDSTPVAVAVAGDVEMGGAM